jgi:hypothetical protein
MCDICEWDRALKTNSNFLLEIFLDFKLITDSYRGGRRAL